MPESDEPRVESRVDGETLEVSLGGRFVLATAGPALAALQGAALPASGAVRRVRLELSAMREADVGVLAVLSQLVRSIEASGREVHVEGADEAARHALAILGESERRATIKDPPSGEGILQQVGRTSHYLFMEGVQIFAFVGEMVVASVRAIRRPRSVNWSDVGRLMEHAGADAVPIVCLLSFLVGLVMGFQGAIQLKQFGANIYVADLVALVVARELGPLMTAIILAGRSGAGFAAELGTMKVSEEVDALYSLGLDPYRFLVYPRVLALVVVTPLLVLIADLVALSGGLFVGLTGLDLTARAYLLETQSALTLWDIGSGLVKSVFFAGAIALVACERGLMTRGGAEGVGRSTTSAVVAGIFHIVVIDAVFTVVFHVLGL